MLEKLSSFQFYSWSVLEIFFFNLPTLYGLGGLHTLASPLSPMKGTALKSKLTILIGLSLPSPIGSRKITIICPLKLPFKTHGQETKILQVLVCFVFLH